MPEENKDVIDAEKVEETSAEKKEGKFGKWWKGVKKDFADGALESKIENVWDSSHERFDLTPYNGGLFGSFPVYGTLNGDVLTVFGKHELDIGSVVIATKDKKAYYVKNAAPSKVKVACEGIEYERDGLDITLDANVNEVKVIKADGRYFIYHGSKE